MKRQLFAFACITMLVGCATPKDKGVVVGMNMEEVRNLAGEPSRKKKFNCPEGARNCNEIWQYDGSSVVFSDGSVVSAQ